MKPITRTSRAAAHDDLPGVSRWLLRSAVVSAGLALHLMFAVVLVRAGTDAERIAARQQAELIRAVADLGTLPTIHVIGRRAS